MSGLIATPLLFALGALLFLPASAAVSYPFFLFALFVIAVAAAEVGVTHAAVRNRVSRLRGRLRAELSTLREQS